MLIEDLYKHSFSRDNSTIQLCATELRGKNLKHTEGLNSMENCLIKKRIIQSGQKQKLNYPPDTKVKFHYVTRTVDEGQKIIDDSRKHKEPMEIIFGKKFKFEPWEECLKSMTCGEISSFTIDEKLTGTYPLVSRSLREIFLEKSHSHTPVSSQCCAMAAMNKNGLGYDDLNELVQNPQPLEFILEVLDIETPGSYEKDAWAMSSLEKTSQIPKLKEEGNNLYKGKEYELAADKYALAIGLIERLAMQERPGSEEQKALDEQKVPLLLNFSQCQLIKGNWYEVIQHTTDALAIQPDNVKALYRRAKANAEVWRIDDAKQDYKRVCAVDPSLTNKVKADLQQLDNAIRNKNLEDKKKLMGKLFST